MYSKINLSKYRFIMLDNIGKLKQLQDNKHYVAPNYKGYSYFLIFITIILKTKTPMNILQLIQVNPKNVEKLIDLYLIHLKVNVKKATTLHLGVKRDVQMVFMNLVVIK